MAAAEPWWRKPIGDRAVGDAIQTDAAAMEAQKQDLRAKMIVWESFTRGEPIGDLHFSMARSSASWNPVTFNAFQETPSLNVIGVVVDALMSWAFALQPFVSFDTTGAKFKIRQLAQRKTRFVDGVWYQNQLYDSTSMCGRDAAVFGTGFIKGSVPQRKSKRIVLERVHPDNVLFDFRDAAKGRPRRMIHRDFLQKDVVKQAFPKFAEEIDRQRSVFGFLGNGQVLDEWCVLLEGWWLSPDPRQDGRHVLAVGNTVLLDEPWELKRIPLEWFSYGRVSDGIMGKGIVQDLLPLQVALDENERNIADGIRKMAHAKILKHISNQVPDTFFDNENGTIIPWQGEHPPAFICPEPMPVQVFERSASIIAQMFQRARMSTLMTKGEIPKSINSGEGIETYQENVSQGFLDVGQRYENFHCRIAGLTCDLAGLYGARTEYRGDVIAWDEVRADGLDLIKAFPVASLPQTPAARKERIERDFQKGLLSREDYLRLRQYPDNDAWVNDEIAPRLLIEEQLDRIMDDGLYQAPNPYMDNATALEVAIKRHNRAELDGEDDSTLGLLERYIDAAKYNLNSALLQRQALAPSPNPVQALVPAGAPALPQ